MSQSIRDVIQRTEQADQDAKDKRAAALAANTSAQDASDMAEKFHAELAADIKAAGPVYRTDSSGAPLLNPDGSVTVYTPDQSDSGFHRYSVMPDSVMVKEEPAPTPAPTPPGPVVSDPDAGGHVNPLFGFKPSS